jgi:hypothetical protein
LDAPVGLPLLPGDQTDCGGMSSAAVHDGGDFVRSESTLQGFGNRVPIDTAAVPTQLIDDLEPGGKSWSRRLNLRNEPRNLHLIGRLPRGATTRPAAYGAVQRKREVGLLSTSPSFPADLLRNLHRQTPVRGGLQVEQSTVIVG